MNVCSLTKNFDHFNILLSELNVSFDILAITETKIKKESSTPINIWLSNYSIEHTQTELSAGGTLLNINKGLSYQLRNVLRLYDPGKTEPTFIEIISSKSTVMVGCIYKHATLPINILQIILFLPYYWNCKENHPKKKILLGDFNIDLLKYEISDS